MSFARMCLLLFSGTLLAVAIGFGTASHPQAIADEPSAAAAPSPVFSAAEREGATRLAVRRLLFAKSLSLRTPREDRQRCREILRDRDNLDALVAEVEGLKGQEIDRAAGEASDLPDFVDRLLAVLQKYWPFILEAIKTILALVADPQAAIRWLFGTLGVIV